MVCSGKPRVLALVCTAFLLASCAAARSPLIAWKERLFGTPDPPPVDAPASGVVVLSPGRPERLLVDGAAPKRKFPQGTSRYRVVELPRTFAHATLQVRVLARPRSRGRGNSVFRPVVYVLDDAEKVKDAVEVKPLHLDIRPFRRTRLLGCAMLEKVERFAVATEPGIVGKSYESEVRDAIKAPTQGGFYYATDAVKVKLPYAETGELTLEVTKEPAAGKGC
jgi:hypothetical protein